MKLFVADGFAQDAAFQSTTIFAWARFADEAPQRTRAAVGTEVNLLDFLGRQRPRFIGA